MSEESTKKNVNNDEIDIFEFMNRIGGVLKGWMNATGRAILISTVFLLKRWLPLSLTIIVGLVAAFIIQISLPPVYTSDLVLKTNVISNEQMIAYINRLKTIKDKSVLAKTLDISEEISNNIISIGAFWIIDQNRDTIPDKVDYSNTHNVYDTINIRMKDRFDIQARVKTPQDLSMVRDGLLNFINNNQLFQERNKQRLDQISERINRFDIDLARLDSLQKVKFFEETRIKSSQSVGQIIFSQEQNQNTQLLYNDIYFLIRQKQFLEAEQNTYGQIVTILNDFTIPAERTNSIAYYAIRIIPLLLIPMLLILICIAQKEAIKRIFEKY